MAKLKANIITSQSDKNIGGQTEQSQIIVIAFKAAMCWHIFLELFSNVFRTHIYKCTLAIRCKSLHPQVLW